MPSGGDAVARPPSEAATTVEYYEGDGSENGYDLEVFNALGHTVAVVNVLESQLEALRDDEVLCARVLQPA